MLARALWWAPPGYDHPAALDCLWVSSSVTDPATTAAQLLTDGHTALRSAGMPRLPEYNLDVPTSWREERATREAVAWRCHAAAQAGLDHPVERLSLTWTSSSTPLPPRSTRVTFEPASDGAFLEAFRGVAQGSLDLLTRRNLAAIGPDAQARDDMDFYLGLPGRRDRWRLAHYHDGTPVGLIIPSRSAESASVSYLGILPQARGHRYVDDLLAEITHLHAEDGAARITANTDTTNHPMAAAFQRAGYQVTKIRLVMAPPPD